MWGQVAKLWWQHFWVGDIKQALCHFEVIVGHWNKIVLSNIVWVCKTLKHKVLWIAEIHLIVNITPLYINDKKQLQISYFFIMVHKTYAYKVSICPSLDKITQITMTSINFNRWHRAAIACAVHRTVRLYKWHHQLLPAEGRCKKSHPAPHGVNNSDACLLYDLMLSLGLTWAKSF